VKTKTFKQFQLERLIKDGTVIPDPKLAKKPRVYSYNAAETLRCPLRMRNVIVRLPQQHQMRN
jgi:hypothetical protein